MFTFTITNGTTTGDTSSYSNYGSASGWAMSKLTIIEFDLEEFKALIKKLACRSGWIERVVEKIEHRILLLRYFRMPRSTLWRENIGCLNFRRI